jgi:hypothetical protein
VKLPPPEALKVGLSCAAANAVLKTTATFTAEEVERQLSKARLKILCDQLNA